MTRELLGRSAGGLPIEWMKLTEGPVPLLLIGGVHGDEPEGFFLVEKFVESRLWAPLQGLAALWVIPRLNPDGCSKNERTNDNGVDLNRNMPTKDWSPEARAPRYQPGPAPASEPETKALITAIERLKPRCVISAHSWNPMINYNGPCRALAAKMAEFNKYEIHDDIGYPTPGSLGTWAGWERSVPVITLEIERDSPDDTIWQTHSRALAEGLLFAAKNSNLDSSLENGGP